MNLSSSPLDEDDPEIQDDGGFGPGPFGPLRNAGPPEDDADCARRQRELAMRAFLDSERVCMHPSASCEMREFFAEFDRFCRDSGVRQFKTAWKDVWNERGLHLARRRGSRRLMGVQIAPSRGAPGGRVEPDAGPRAGDAGRGRDLRERDPQDQHFPMDIGRTVRAAFIGGRLRRRA